MTEPPGMGRSLQRKKKKSCYMPIWTKEGKNSEGLVVSPLFVLKIRCAAWKRRAAEWAGCLSRFYRRLVANRSQRRGPLGSVKDDNEILKIINPTGPVGCRMYYLMLPIYFQRCTADYEQLLYKLFKRLSYCSWQLACFRFLPLQL